MFIFFFFSSRRRHTRLQGDWSSDVCSSDLRTLASEWGHYGIRVNSICPGFFPSKLANGLIDKLGDQLIARAPLRRIGGEEDLKDRKSTRLNSSHLVISYAVFCLKKKIQLQVRSAVYGSQLGTSCLIMNVLV